VVVDCDVDDDTDVVDDTDVEVAVVVDCDVDDETDVEVEVVVDLLLCLMMILVIGFIIFRNVVIWMAVVVGWEEVAVEMDTYLWVVVLVGEPCQEVMEIRLVMLH